MNKTSTSHFNGIAREQSLPPRTETAAEKSASDGRLRSPSVAVRLIHFPAGVAQAPPARNTAVMIHVGAPTQISCNRGGDQYRGIELHGDIDIIPAGIPSAWETNVQSTGLLVSLQQALFDDVAVESGIDPARIQITSRYLMRDPQIEHIGWALKAEMEADFPSGNLLLESLGTALAAHLLHRHSSHSLPMRELKGGMSGLKLRQVLAYIENNLDRNLSLTDIAAVANLSVSHLKTLFRQSTGMPVHQYVIRRRVEQAKELLSEGKLPIGQVALATGFAHQSHLARHMRHLLGVTPTAIRKNHL